MSIFPRSILIVLLGLSSASGYVASNHEVRQAHHHDHQSHALSATETTGELRSIGKPGTAIAELQQSVFNLQPASTQEVALQIRSNLNEGTLWIQVSNSPAVTGATLEADWQVDLTSTKEITLPLQVSVQDPGEYRVNIIAHHLIDGKITQSRALAAELRIGNRDAVAFYEKSAVKRYPDYVGLPAQETIR